MGTVQHTRNFIACNGNDGSQVQKQFETTHKPSDNERCKYLTFYPYVTRNFHVVTFFPFSLFYQKKKKTDMDHKPYTAVDLLIPVVNVLVFVVIQTAFFWIVGSEEVLTVVRNKVRMLSNARYMFAYRVS